MSRILDPRDQHAGRADLMLRLERERVDREIAAYRQAELDRRAAIEAERDSDAIARGERGWRTSGLRSEDPRNVRRRELRALHRGVA